MAKLGSPVSKKFSIGTAELRVGPMSEAGKLQQARSIGLIDNVTVEVSQTSVDLMGGFPKQIVDTAITEQAGNVTATLREYSRNNLGIMLGLGAQTAVTDVATTTTAQVTTPWTTVPVTSAAGITIGDLIVVYPSGQPELLAVTQVTGIATNDLTVDPPLPANMPSGALVFVARQLAIGNIQTTSYFSVSVIQQERATGRPVGFHFWKAAVGSGMTYGTNADDFASTEMNLKILQPAIEEYGVGGDLAHLDAIIPTHPTGIAIFGA